MSSTTTSSPKIFSSADLDYAMQQAERNGYKVLVQDRVTSNIKWQSAVVVVQFKPAATPKANHRGETILGQLQMKQTRKIEFDPRSKEEQLLGIHADRVRSFTKTLVHFEQVTSPAMAALQPGHAFGPQFYLAEVVSFSPSWDGDKGIVVSGDMVRRYSAKFLESTAYGPRKADRLVLTAEEHAALTSTPNGDALHAPLSKRETMLNVVRERQFAAGVFTLADLQASIARAANGKPDEDHDEQHAADLAQAAEAEARAHGAAGVDLTTGELQDAPEASPTLTPTGFGS